MSTKYENSKFCNINSSAIDFSLEISPNVFTFTNQENTYDYSSSLLNKWKALTTGSRSPVVFIICQLHEAARSLSLSCLCSVSFPCVLSTNCFHDYILMIIKLSWMIQK